MEYFTLKKLAVQVLEGKLAELKAKGTFREMTDNEIRQYLVLEFNLQQLKKGIF